MYSWCLQETAVTVSVEIVWLALSPGRRRLRFSFQFNDVKDRDRLSPAPLFSAGGRRRRLSSDRPLWCQSAFSGPLRQFREPRKLAAKTAAGCRGASLFKSVAIRLRLGKIRIYRRKSSADFRLWIRFCFGAPTRAGGGYLVAVSHPVNRPFRGLFRRVPEAPEPAGRSPREAFGDRSP